MSLILYLRCLFFGLFIVCNAIICSVAVWHLSLAQAVGYNLILAQIDTFLIFLGAFALAFIFTIIFVNLARRRAVTSHVWFECLWVGLFWVMELAGAAALTAIFPNIMCDAQVESLARQSCTSSKVLLAFSWICTIVGKAQSRHYIWFADASTTVLLYFIILVVSAIIHHQQNTHVWHSRVWDFPWFASHLSLKNLPELPSPATKPRAGPRPLSLAAPQPRRAVPAEIYSHRAGLDSQYEIEHYRPPTTIAERPVPPVPAAAPPQHMVQASRQAVALPSVPSLYPHHMQSTMAPATRLPALRSQTHPQASSGPNPLGEWPRADILTRARSDRRKGPPSSFQSTSTKATSRPPPSMAVSNQPTSPTRPRPTGPRTRSSSSESQSHRPPPLDLSNISSFRNMDSRTRRG
ncbi:hypothetical protein JAAARDRAFT_559769 [Jaapia argillacea MUCL 33604]|uniref:MARVEL domain-containing protein n=1 Tax=Jaapia argillacea MUCL 33604 TaxID=933084 RepID=A0A067QDP5_9AGAM|nr:hypothetical protein JAAARDRAFT_559769 [Jaapia argillacea MUCL 33604]